MASKYYGTDAKTPVGDLVWVDITEGSAYLEGKVKFNASLELKTDSPECAKLIAAIRAEWKEHKVAGASKPKLPFRVKRTKTDEEDENGDAIYVDTDYTVFTASTVKFNKDGDVNTVAVFNSKGAKVSLGNQQIGNGSRGLLMVTIKVYTITDKKTGVIANTGVSMYLKGIQLAKFKPYSARQVEAPEALSEEEGDFEGVEPELVEELPADAPQPTKHVDEGTPTVDL